MSLIHSFVEHASSGLTGIQATHRDWSPYVVHFTAYSTMTPVRKGISNGLTPSLMANALDAADAQSFQTVKKIASTNALRRSIPDCKSQVPACVCFSECNLAGLIALSERYGRFGFVYEKAEIFGASGRPCIYVDRDAYGFISKNVSSDPEAAKLIGLANVYSPPGYGQVQDYTHEREWRIFRDIDFAALKPRYYLSPDPYVSQMRTLFGADSTVIPIDKLFLWGA